MSRFAVVLLAGLLGCAGLDSEPPSGFASGDMQGWRFASGKRPTRAEHAAIVAACQDGAISASQGRALDACLADLGLRREQ